MKNVLILCRKERVVLVKTSKLFVLFLFYDFEWKVEDVEISKE